MTGPTTVALREIRDWALTNRAETWELLNGFQRAVLAIKIREAGHGVDWAPIFDHIAKATPHGEPEHGRFDVVGWHDARALPRNARPPRSWPCASRWNGHECSLYDQHTGTHVAAADNSGRVIAEWAATS